MKPQNMQLQFCTNFCIFFVTFGELWQQERFSFPAYNFSPSERKPRTGKKFSIVGMRNPGYHRLAFVSFPPHSRKACFSQKRNDGANELSALSTVLAESLLSAKEERQRSERSLPNDASPSQSGKILIFPEEEE